MAIRIPILTSFDPKGLKQANAQLGKLRGSIGSLGKNFAVAGAVIAGAGALIGRAVADAAESQKVFAQTEAVLKSMGTTANGTAQDIANLASSLQKSTAFSDEAILAGQNLLLTFKNIQNQAGAGNDIFDQTSTLMLDVARAMGTTASGEAIRLGKALNDPVKGISALTRVGIQFTDQQKEQIKALAESGDLMGAQKIILAELQQQFGGSAAAYAGTFAGQLEGLNNDLNDMSEEIGFMVMPALQGMLAEFRDLIPIIGPQLKAAIESVDWKALTTSVVSFTTFLVQNATTIANVVVGIFALNTAFKLMQVAIGISNVVIALKTWYMAQLATGMTNATIATNLFSGALRLIPWIGAIAGIGAFITEYVRLKTAIDNSNTSLSRFNTETIAITGAVAKLDPITTAWQRITIAILGAVTAQKQFNNQPVGKAGRTSVLDDYAYNLKSGQPTASGKNLDAGIADSFKAVGGSGSKATKAASKAGKIVGEVFGEGFNSSSSRIIALTKELTEQLITSTPILDEWKELGSLLGNQIIEGLQQQVKRVAAIGLGVGSSQLKQAKAQSEKLYKIAEALQNRLVERTKFQVEMKKDIMSLFDFAEAGKGIDNIIKKFRKQVEETKNFRDNLLKLSQMGLSQELFKQIAENKDFAAAAELVKGGAGAVGEINALYSELDVFSSQIASMAGNQLYNLGIDAATGYIRTLEAGFIDLNKYAKILGEKQRAVLAVEAMENLIDWTWARDAQGNLYQTGNYEGDMSLKDMKNELARLQGQVSQFNDMFGNQLRNLDQVIANDLFRLTGQTNTGLGVSSGRSITINVNGGMSTSSDIGRAVIQAIDSYERSSGQYFARA